VDNSAAVRQKGGENTPSDPSKNEFATLTQFL